ncbi:hypothetical protein RIEPE_0302 [Candidatus Riesia pediculicola USDA]|uniref:Uncharacterized protein n=1 Tax=Riesia pediculicola (strain USDA) TaxID=515618 RepID=D4G896_RIEPU|nr:hypothetical protein RIEPE_0302 [Candidatus Riesia pediculicola USDA]
MRDLIKIRVLKIFNPIFFKKFYLDFKKCFLKKILIVNSTKKNILIIEISL